SRRYESPLGQRQWRRGWRVLIFPLNVAYPRPSRRIERETRDGIYSLGIRPAIVVNKRLPEVITLPAAPQRRPRNSRQARVDRVQLDIHTSRRQFEFAPKLFLQRCVNTAGFHIGIHPVIVRLRDQSRTLPASPRAMRQKAAVNQSESHQPLNRRIDPAIHRHIRRAHIGSRRLFEHTPSVAAPAFPFLST